MIRPEADAVLGSVRRSFRMGSMRSPGVIAGAQAPSEGVDIVTTADLVAFVDRLSTAGGAVTGVNEEEVSLSLRGARVNIRFTEQARYGTALLCATGSREFLARLAGVAQELGYRLEPGGLVGLCKWPLADIRERGGGLQVPRDGDYSA